LNGIPAGETPRVPACAPPAHTDIPPSTTAATAGKEEIQAKGLALCVALWPPEKRRTLRFRDRRDQRLLYRLAILRLDPRHSHWVKQLVDEVADARPKNPLALLQAQMKLHGPEGVSVDRLLRSIDVPLWALADPRDWCPNGEFVQQE
jgi:hypothetical protein